MHGETEDAWRDVLGVCGWSGVERRRKSLERDAWRAVCRDSVCAERLRMHEETEGAWREVLRGCAWREVCSEAHEALGEGCVERLCVERLKVRGETEGAW